MNKTKIWFKTYCRLLIKGSGCHTTINTRYNRQLVKMFYASWGFVKSCLDWNLERDPTALKMPTRVPPDVKSIPEVPSWSLIFVHIVFRELENESYIYPLTSMVRSLRCKSCYLQMWCTDECVMWRLILRLTQWSGPTLAYPYRAHLWSVLKIKQKSAALTTSQGRIGGCKYFFRYWRKSFKKTVRLGWSRRHLFHPPPPTIKRSPGQPVGAWWPPFVCFSMLHVNLFVCLVSIFCFSLLFDWEFET